MTDNKDRSELVSVMAEVTRLKDELFNRYPDGERWRVLSDVELPALLERVRAVVIQSVVHSARTGLDKSYRNLISLLHRKVKQRLDDDKLPSEETRQRMAAGLYELVSSLTSLANDPTFPPRDTKDFELVQQVMQKAGEVFAQRDVPIACPRCGHEEWAADVYGTVVARLPVSGGFPIPPPYIPVLATTCKNCGFISTHNLSALGIEL